ncbi:cobalamin-binding protein [Rossellomorea vietnamensis]|uniref:Cobalamin-binding protein n=1 Tax=Rossellomorea vietnamensis TaxID=218284 RepID=A0A5D4NHY5_9BACI|nr:cobalamin-binding protein [Rossellomorea vietnamensis]TYS13429.1 cobalamin-binding protein [Rossellomorea vietnamensis]
MRIVSICPSNTEVVDYLGLTSFLVGVDDFSDFPEEVNTLPKLGPDLSINMDKVEELQPDLILASLSVPGMEKNIEELKKRSLPYIVTDPQSFDDIADDLLTVGKACGIETKAKEMRKEFREKITLLEEAARITDSAPELYWEWWPKPVFTPGRINWLTELSVLAGARNIYRDVELSSIQTDWADVHSRNPDYICLAWVGVRREKVNPAVVKKRAGWDTLQAVAEDRILVLQEELYCRPSPRLLEGALKLGHILHPDQYSHIKF